MPDIPFNAWDSDRVQSFAQGLILRENGYKCSFGEIYYCESKKRVKVDFDFFLENKTMFAINEVKEFTQKNQIPSPLVDSQKCVGCSLAGICLPDEINFLTGKIHTTDDVRRLHPLRQEALPAYIVEPYGQITKKEDVIIFKVNGKYVNSLKIIDMSQLCIFGNAQITTQALKQLMINDIPVCWFSSGAWFTGITSGLGHKNIELRINQYRWADDNTKAIKLASQFVSGKIKNSRTIIRRNHPQPPKHILDELTRLAKSALNKRKFDSLLGVEGAAAKVYFSIFSELLKKSDDSILDFDFKNRNRRPPKDPINALISYLYAILLKDIHIVLLSVGFDPFLGFLHQPKYGKPALALDLMEEFRSIIADSVAISAINNGEIKITDFTIRGNNCSLTNDGRRKILAAYERRIDATVKHPLFGYAISYRRILEVQARLLARTIMGEISQYKPFTTR